jgi:hypothetical protein
MKRLAVLCCILLTMGATNALASMSGTLYVNGSTVYPDVSDTSADMIGINAISSNLTWSVEQLDNGLWDYTYTLNPLRADKPSGAGSIIIEFGDTPTELTWDYSFTGAWESYMNTATTDGVVKTIDKTAGSSTEWSYHSWLPDGTVVDVANTFEGMEWLLGDGIYHYGSQYLTLHLTTDLAPTWGNVYFDGFNETTHNGYGMLRNSKYDIDPTSPFVYDESLVYAASEFLGWVVTPGGAAAVPIPASLLLFGSGLGGLFIFKRRNQVCC